MTRNMNTVASRPRFPIESLVLGGLWYKDSITSKERMMKVSRLTLGVAGMLLAASCVKTPERTTTSGTAQAAHGGPVRIGFSMDTLKEERWQRDKALVERRAQEVGAELGEPGGK